VLVSGLVGAALLGAAAASGCSSSSGSAADVVSSQSYRGHENDGDINAFVNAYPHVVGTRLDDCQTCHTGGEIADDQGQTSQLNPCTYCHLIPYPDAAVVAGAPADYQATLNPYGRQYDRSGRSEEALRSIEGNDSDGDSFDNATEIAQLRYPGDADSKPGQPAATIRTFSWEELTALADHEQFLLLNSHKQQFDVYASYRGVRVATLLEAAGADLSQATGATFFAPDGYTIDVDVRAITEPFPPGIYYAGLDPGGFADPGQGFVQYPPDETQPAGLVDGEAIPGEPWLLVGYERDGLPLDASYLDAVTGRLNGEGPYRSVVPQGTPGAPDRGSNFSPSGYDDGYDYDDSKDHNAGSCVRGLVAIRVNPMPAGYEEFDWKNGGYSLVDKQQLIVYGLGITGE
jgi:hypothetical protein